MLQTREMTWQAPLLRALLAAVLAAGCFAPTPDDACAALANKLCECGPAACEAAPALLTAARALEGRAGRDGLAACRAELSRPLRCTAPTAAGGRS